jgi:transcriptional regulator with XRE-family HTH domain
METQTVPSNHVRRYREKRQWTLRKLGALVGSDIAHLSKIERGLIIPNGITREKIADALGIPRHVLFPDDAPLETSA